MHCYKKSVSHHVLRHFNLQGQGSLLTRNVGDDVVTGHQVYLQTELPAHRLRSPAEFNHRTQCLKKEEEWRNSMKYAVLLQTHLVHRFRSGSRGQVLSGITSNPMAASAAPGSLHNAYFPELRNKWMTNP
jgi:hypothetical protein